MLYLWDNLCSISRFTKGILISMLFIDKSTFSTINGVFYAVNISDSIMNIGLFPIYETFEQIQLSYDSSFGNELI